MAEVGGTFARLCKSSLQDKPATGAEPLTIHPHKSWAVVGEVDNPKIPKWTWDSARSLPSLIIFKEGLEKTKQNGPESREDSPYTSKP